MVPCCRAVKVSLEAMAMGMAPKPSQVASWVSEGATRILMPFTSSTLLIWRELLVMERRPEWK